MLSLQQPIAESANARVNSRILRKALLFCVILSSILYIAINIIVQSQYPGYDASSYTVSELSAIDTPTRTLWVLLCSFYSLLLLALALGIWLASAYNAKLRF